MLEVSRMIASERRVAGGPVTGKSRANPGISQILQPKSGRAVKIYVIDPRKFQEGLDKIVDRFSKTPETTNTSSASTIKNDSKKETVVAVTPKTKAILPAPDTHKRDGSDVLTQRKDIFLTNIAPSGSFITNVTPNGSSLANTAANGSFLTNIAPNGSTVSLPPLDQQINAGVVIITDGSVLMAPAGSDKPEVKPKRKLPKKKKSGKRRKIAPRSVQKESIQEEKAEAAELAFLMKETTTRTGRLSKSSTAAAAATITSSSSSTTAVPTVGVSQPASPLGSGICSGPTSAVPSPSPSLSSVNSQGQRVKKREPPEMFRCQTCLKVYLGHTKLNLHFQKFPTHQKSEVPVKKKQKLKTGTKNRGTNTGIILPNYSQNQVSTSTNGIFTSSDNNYSNNFLQLADQLSGPLSTPTSTTVSQSTAEIQTDPTDAIEMDVSHNQNNNYNQSISTAVGFEAGHEGLHLGRLSSFLPTLSLSCANLGLNNNSSSIINPDTLSDNCSSPNLPDYSTNVDDINPTVGCLTPMPEVSNTDSLYGSSMDPTFLQANSPLHQNHCEGLLPITVPDMLPSGRDEGMASRTDEYFMDFQADFINPDVELTELSEIPSELIGNGSCSQQSFNSLENLLADSNSALGETSPLPALPISVGLCGGDEQLSTNRNAFFPSCLPEGHQIVQQNSISNPSSYINHCTNNNNCNSITPIDEESRDICITEDEMNISNNMLEEDISALENSMDGCESEIIIQPSPSSSNMASCSNNKQRSIWEFVKEQIRLRGINQTCGEISEMADKLSKVARDKFYPVLEEEIERMSGTPPIIQVDTLFVSHLLDLPMGTYIYKEDGGIRKIIPPPTPISSELSLTGGAEVDMDKFLSPDIDLISLPHLTNLDFAVICNE